MAEKRKNQAAHMDEHGEHENARMETKEKERNEISPMEAEGKHPVALMGEEGSAYIRPMAMEDYDAVYALWQSIHGFGIRSVDDSREGVERFLLRNPTTSIVAEISGQIVGAILCGHDGRRGCFYHVCVRESYRKQGIGKRMAVAAMEALRAEGISKVCLIAFRANQVGNQFWKSVGWTFREDLNYYDFTINEENVVRFNE